MSSIPEHSKLKTFRETARYHKKSGSCEGKSGVIARLADLFRQLPESDKLSAITRLNRLSIPLSLVVTERLS